MEDEEIILLEEQLATAHAEIEGLQARAAQAEDRAAGLEVQAAQLRRELDDARSEAQEQRGLAAGHAADAEAARGALAEAREEALAAAARYREVVLAREPEVPADLVVGDTVAAIDEAMASARQTVARVRQHLEQQAQGLRVPPGAPARSAPDFSGLSDAEKIRLGLQAGQ